MLNECFICESKNVEITTEPTRSRTKRCLNCNNTLTSQFEIHNVGIVLFYDGDECMIDIVSEKDFQKISNHIRDHVEIIMDDFEVIETINTEHGVIHELDWSGYNIIGMTTFKLEG